MEEEYQTEKKSKSKTKKRKSQLTSLEKNKIWEILDNDCETTPSTVECVYESNPDMCTNCNSILMNVDDGFPTCVNPDCGRIFKDVVDLSP